MAAIPEKPESRRAPEIDLESFMSQLSDQLGNEMGRRLTEFSAEMRQETNEQMGLKAGMALINECKGILTGLRSQITAGPRAKPFQAWPSSPGE